MEREDRHCCWVGAHSFFFSPHTQHAHRTHTVLHCNTTHTRRFHSTPSLRFFCASTHNFRFVTLPSFFLLLFYSVFKKGKETLFRVAVSEDSSVVAVGSTAVILYDVTSKGVLKKFAGHGGKERRAEERKREERDRKRKRGEERLPARVAESNIYYYYFLLAPVAAMKFGPAGSNLLLTCSGRYDMSYLLCFSSFLSSLASFLPSFLPFLFLHPRSLLFFPLLSSFLPLFGTFWLNCLLLPFSSSSFLLLILLLTRFVYLWDTKPSNEESGRALQTFTCDSNTLLLDLSFFTQKHSHAVSDERGERGEMRGERSRGKRREKSGEAKKERDAAVSQGKER